MCFLLYGMFKSSINMCLPLSDSIAEFVAQEYVDENISANTSQIGNVDKNIKEGWFEVDFFCIDNRDIFFRVYVDSGTFSVFKDTYISAVCNNIFSNNFEEYFNDCFGKVAFYEVNFNTPKLNDGNIDLANLELSQINKFCKSIELNININYNGTVNYNQYNSSALKFISYCIEHNVNIDKIYLNYYSSSKIMPDYSYELRNYQEK